METAVTDSIFIYKNPQAAGPGKGRLQGLSVALQPTISVAGWPAEAGSKALAGFKALEDATIVQRLRAAGAHLCGLTRMSEFGFGLDGSGAGGALRAKSADAELVMDLMGESRLAAMRAAVFGFKPGYGLLSRLGLIGLVPSMECCGVLSADINTIRGILAAAAGPDELDFSLPDEKAPDFSPQEIDPAKTSIGFIREAQAALPAGQAEKFRSSLDELKKAGFILKELSLPEYPLFSLVHRIAGPVEASSCLGRYDSVRYGPREPGSKNWNEMYLLSRGAAFGPLIKGYLIQGAYFQFERYGAFKDACRIRARLVAGMQRLSAQADFLAFPAVDAAPQAAPSTLAETYAQFASTLFANVTGRPALYLPPVSGAAGAGIQLSGPRLCDARLLALGELITNTRGGGK